MVAEFASGLRVRMGGGGEPPSSDEGGVVGTVLQGGSSMAPPKHPGLCSPPPVSIPCLCPSEEPMVRGRSVSGVRWAGGVRVSIPAVGLKANQNPSAYPSLRSRPPCCRMQIRRKF